jgi:hypothetical protein
VCFYALSRDRKWTPILIAEQYTSPNISADTACHTVHSSKSIPTLLRFAAHSSIPPNRPACATAILPTPRFKTRNAIPTGACSGCTWHPCNLPLDPEGEKGSERFKWDASVRRVPLVSCRCWSRIVCGVTFRSSLVLSVLQQLANTTPISTRKCAN